MNPLYHCLICFLVKWVLLIRNSRSSLGSFFRGPSALPIVVLFQGQRSVLLLFFACSDLAFFITLAVLFFALFVPRFFAGFCGNSGLCCAYGGVKLQALWVKTIQAVIKTLALK